MAKHQQSRGVGFRDVLRVREFRALWLAEAQSMAGDQLARVALSVLVFERTSSSALTALTYALTFLPALLGGAFLSGLADRLPRRDVMVCCDLLRAGLLALMALPGLPLPVIGALLVVAVIAGSPFLAAENALVPTILDGERYVVGTALRTITGQLAQLAGFAGGGLVIAAISPRGGLAVDAASYLVSALLVRVAVERRPAVRSDDGTGPRAYLASIASGARFVAADPRLRVLLGLGWLAGLFVIPEGVAAPYAAQLGGGAQATGLLMASMPAGTALGTFLFMKLVSPAARRLWIGPLAVGNALPLAACLSGPPLVVSLALWFVSGVCAAYLAQVYAEYARSVPDEWRGQAIGIAGSGTLAVQGLGVLAGGALASGWDPSGAVGIAGGVEALLAVLLGIAWRRFPESGGPGSGLDSAAAAAPAGRSG